MLHADVPTFSLLIAHNSLPKKLFLLFFYITAQRDGHAELVSASHCEPLFTPFPGGILKQVQDDHQLCTPVFCYIEEAYTKGTIKRAKTNLFAVRMLGDPSQAIFLL